MDKETEYISVWLSKKGKKRKAFRCINCGKIAFEYTGDVKLIVEGNNTEDCPNIVQCKGVIEKRDIYGNKYSERCHTKYVIS